MKVTRLSKHIHCPPKTTHLTTCDIYHNNDSVTSATPSLPIIPKSLPSFFKSRSHRFVLIGLVVVVLGLLYFLSVKTPLFGPKAPTVKLETEYQNPFNRNTQYANPFDQYKNPFANL